MATLHLDFETRSKANLKRCGSAVYAADPSTQVLCAAWVIGENPAGIRIWRRGEPIPAEWLVPGLTVSAHNVTFERNIWLRTLGLPEPARWECTMAMSAAFNIPLSLDEASKFLRLVTQKDKEGHALMLKMMRHSYEGKETPEEFDRLCHYCIQDVVVELELHKKLCKALSAYEQKVFTLDQKINTRGIHVDLETAAAIMEIIEGSKSTMGKDLLAYTDGAVETGTQVARIMKWLAEHGSALPNLTADTVEEALQDPDLPTIVRRVLEIRQRWSLGSIGKYNAMLIGNVDGKMYDLIQYCGASQTGRWAGRRVQIQNLPRVYFSDNQIETAIQLFRNKDVAGLEWAFGDVFTPAKQLIRSMFHSDTGVIVSDFAQIEARCVAWLAAQKDLVQDFARGAPVYEKMASRIFRTPIDKVTKMQRQAGKCVILGAGYGLGSTGFQNSAKGFGLVFDMNKSKAIVDTYRAAYPDIVDFWYETYGSFRAALLGKLGQDHKVGWNMKVRAVSPTTLRLTLPSGRRLWWHGCKIEPGERSDSISYRSASGNRVRTHGGVLTENITQAVARDLLADAMLRLDAEGYRIVAHVHDEVVVENVTELDVQKINGIMVDSPAWAVGLPVDAETKICPLKRYTK